MLKPSCISNTINPISPFSTTSNPIKPPNCLPITPLGSPSSSFFHSTLRPIFHHISSLIPSFSRTAIFSINPSIHQSSHLFSPRLINIIMLYSSILLSTYHILVSFTSSTCRSRFCLIRGFYTIFSSWKGVIPSPWLQICHLPLNVGISTVQMLIGRVGVGIRAGGDC